MNEFNVGSVLSRSVGIWLKNLVPFVIIALVAHAPVLVYTYIAGESLTGIKTWSILVSFIALLCGNIATGAIVYGVLMQLRGEPASIGRCIAVGLGRMFPILGVAIASGLAVGLGVLLLIIPGLIVLTMLYVAVPVAVVERPGVFASLNRSGDLTKGNRWNVFAVVVVQGIITLGLSYVLNKTVFADPTSLGELRTYMMVSQTVTTVLASLSAVFAAVCYHDLKLTKEGATIEELVSVFS